MVKLIRLAGHQGCRGIFNQSVKVVLLFLALAGVALSSSWAQCTPESGCDDCLNKGERLKCKFDALANESDTMINQLQQPPFEKLQTPASLDGLAKSKDRLNKQKDRIHAEDFRLLTKKKESVCQTVEAVGEDGNEDGVCDPGEKCAEAIGDGIGDDDGICERVKGDKKREACAQICDQEAMQDESSVDDGLAADVEDVYDEMTGQAKEMNGALQEVATLVGALEYSADQEDSCALDTGGLSRIHPLLCGLSKTATVTARGLADIAERVCDQQVMMNCAACCAPVEAVAGAFEAAWTAVEINESNINSATLDAALKCVAQMKATAGANATLLAQVESTLSEVEAAQAMVIKLLKMPQGQRLKSPQPPAK